MEQIVDMDISIEEEETDDDAELSELLKGLSGMEKCLIPKTPKTDKAIIGQAEKQTVCKTATPNETNNADISLKNQNKTATEITSKSTKSPTVSVEHIVDVENDNSGKVPSPCSDASTLSRGPTPEKELTHCPKDKETAVPTQIIDNDSDSDVIVEHVIKHHEESSSNLDEKTKNCAMPNNSESDSKSNGTTELDDVEKTPENSHPEGEISVLPVETQDQSKDLDSDSDCLIVEHIAASEHLQNGCIDLTKPAEDEDASFALANRSEESLVEEIIKIRKALRKHDRKKQKKARRRRSQKQKKRSKSKNRIRSPSLDRVSESEDEIRTIMFTESGQLSVNITSNDSSRVSFSSRDSSNSLHKTNVSAENELNQTSVSEDQCGSNNSDSQQSRPEITASTEMADHADSAPLRNFDCENNTKVAKNSINSIKINPLKRKLSYQVHTNLSNTPVKKQIFCESSKELKSKFRRNVIPKAKRDRGGSGVRAERDATLEKTDSFERFMSDSEDDNVNNLRLRSSSSNSGITGKFIQSLCQSKSSRRTPPLLDGNYRKSRSRCRSPNNYRKRNPSSCRSPVRPSRSKSRHKTPSQARDLKSTTKSITRSPSQFSNSSINDSRSVRSKFRTYKSPSPVRSRPSRSRGYRSPSRSRSRSRVYKSPSPQRSPRSKSRTYCSPSRLRRSKSRTYISPSRSRRSKSRTYCSPPRLRRSKSRTYISPSRSRRSKSPTYRSPSRLRRSKSRTYVSPSRLRRSRSRTYISPSRSRRSKSRTYRSPSRSRRSKSRTYVSPSRLRRSKSRTCRSPSRSRRSKSRNHRSPSCSRRSISQGRRSMSRHRTPRKRCASRSPSEIRAARKCSPLENMRQQLKKNNEAAVQQALGGLEKPTTSGVSKTWSVRIIDDVDLTKSSPSPENTTQPFVMNRNAPQIPPNLVYMPMPMAVNPGPGVLNQMNRLQISDVYSQSNTFPEHYVPFYQ